MPFCYSPLRRSAEPIPETRDWLDRGPGARRSYLLLRPLVVGLVHGLAGSAAVALLVLATIDDARWALAYLVLFGIGTIMGMMVITAAIAAPFAFASRRSTRIEHHVRVASGVLSVVLGLFLIYQIGFVGGLFSGIRPRRRTERQPARGGRAAIRAARPRRASLWGRARSRCGDSSRGPRPSRCRPPA